MVVLYASLYDDVHMVVNLSGRFYLEKGIEERLGKEFIDRINKEGYIDVTDKSGSECVGAFTRLKLLSETIPYAVYVLYLSFMVILTCCLQCRKGFIQGN